jgi:uncharacterized membrane protein
MLSDHNGPPPPDNPHAHGVIPKVVPPLPRETPHVRNLPWQTALGWLRKGWADLLSNPLPSLLYGAGVFLVSILVVWLLYRLEFDYFLFPALAGFMVLGPLIANGLYEKSRRLESGESTTFTSMVLVHMRSGYQSLFMGALLLGLFLLWMRAAVLLYALFFGLTAFPGMEEIVPMLLTTPTGWGLLLVGSAVGALFAGFAFAISVFAVPMLLEERTDAMTALGTSMAMVWNNLGVMIAWGAIVLGLFVVCILTGLLGLIVVFPVLGHATWHAYRAIRGSNREGERMFIQPA